MTDADAERWLAAWEAHAAAEGIDRDRDHWRHAFDWIEAERGAR